MLNVILRLSFLLFAESYQLCAVEEGQRTVNTFKGSPSGQYNPHAQKDLL